MDIWLPRDIVPSSLPLLDTPLGRLIVKYAPWAAGVAALIALPFSWLTRAAVIGLELVANFLIGVLGRIVGEAPAIALTAITALIGFLWSNE